MHQNSERAYHALVELEDHQKELETLQKKLTVINRQLDSQVLRAMDALDENECTYTAAVSLQAQSDKLKSYTTS